MTMHYFYYVPKKKEGLSFVDKLDFSGPTRLDLRQTWAFLDITIGIVVYERCVFLWRFQLN